MTSEIPVERLSSLISAAAAVVGEVDLDRVLRRLVSEARSRSGARYAALGVLGNHGVLSDFIHEGVDEETARHIGSLPQGRGVLGTVVREKKTIVLDNISEHPDSYGFPEGHPEMESFLGVPVGAGSRAFGNLYLTDKPGGFTESDVAMVEALALIAGSAVNTARLRERLKATAIIEDRDRIARDLHDSIIQDLFAIGLSLQSMSDRVSEESISVVLDRSVDQLHSVVETLRRYIYELRSADGLRETLSQQLSRLTERMGSAYPTEVTLEVLDDIDEVDASVAEEVLKLVTEVLSNALRHSRAEHLTLQGRGGDGELVITISDDGKGFDPDNVSRGMGLLNMKERVRRLGGKLSIETAEGSGTTVAIRLPTQ
ncbi:MAG: GAF domain-containing sensor histidine kinase [Actinomycetota bacterium]|nr:GAF domain-containing sensor histidine kinase [Actinomycetota bacterium]